MRKRRKTQVRVAGGHAPAGNRRRAFSIIEIFLVVVIVGILSAIAVPRVGNFSANQRVAAAARRVIVELAYAQQLAKRKGTAVTVRFSTVNAALEIVGETHRNHGVGSYLVALGEDPYRVAIASADFDGDGDVVFDGYGVADSGGAVALQLGSYSKTVSLDPDTGIAEVTG